MSTATKPRVELLVLDLDNTVWDWFHAWNESFKAQLAVLIADTGIPQAELEADIRRVHQDRGTSEYSLLLDEVELLKPFVPKGLTGRQRFDPADHALHSARKRQTHLYPGVRETLDAVRTRGVKIIAYTESLAYWTAWRMRRTELDGVIDDLYSSPDHDFPAGVTPESIRTLTDDSYGLKKTAHHHVPRGVVKPDPVILEEIVADSGVSKERVAYVGDSLMKDVEMARRVGVLDVHAEYGEAFRHPEYNNLRRVSHWPDDDVKRETEIEPNARYVLKATFGELLDIFEFGPKK